MRLLSSAFCLLAHVPAAHAQDADPLPDDGPPRAQVVDEADSDAPSLELYASIRMHISAASVDEGFDGDDSFVGIGDSYSQAGAKVRFGFSDTDVTARIAVGLNTAELELGDPSFFDNEDLRAYSVTATGGWGTLVVGKDWLPYYNAVGVPVDYFSSVYAGYSTYAFFRERQVGYTTPEWKGLQGNVARIERTGGGASGWHYTAGYKTGGLTLAVGREDMDGAGDGAVADTQGASASYTSGPWYVAAKYENSDAFGDIYNAFAQYSIGDTWALKAGGAWGDQFSGDSYHIGADYRLADDFKLFAEVYAEQDNYAILRDDADSASDYFGAGGFGARQNGRVLAVGFRKDFTTGPRR